MWYQIRIEHCPQSEVDYLSEQLQCAGALSITLIDKNDHPILEPEPGTTPLWPDVVINALYDDQNLAKQTIAQLSQTHQNLLTTLENIADRDWQRVCMADFKPQKFGNRLWICPSWFSPPEPEAVNVILDPGLAFGTGTHPTTNLCLNWLASTDLTDKNLIDYGCGSGILAIAALKLGASMVQAVDIDPQALQATRNNASINQINHQQLQLSQPKDSLISPVNLVIANILLEPLLSLKNTFHSLLANGNLLVVSGILNQQVSLLIEHYQPQFVFQHSIAQNDWSLAIFKAS